MNTIYINDILKFKKLDITIKKSRIINNLTIDTLYMHINRHNISLLIKKLKNYKIKLANLILRHLPQINSHKSSKSAITDQEANC